MVEIYKRVEKSTEHLHGVERIESTDKPFIISLAAMDIMQSVCGIPKCAMRAARVYSDDEDAGMLRLEDMPIDFLGVRFYSKEPEQEFVSQFLLPYLTSQGTDFESIRSEAAKVNFLTYYNGTYRYKKIEEVLVQQLSGMNFTDEQITGIVSNITLIAVSTDMAIDDLRCTSIKIKDVNDEEVYEERDASLLRDDESFTYSVSPNNPNSVLYVYRGNGEHSVKAHLNDDCIAKPVFCALVISIINKAIANDTLNSDEILTLMEKYSKDNVAEAQRIMEEIDKRIVYDGVRRYDSESLEIRKQLDRTVKTLASVSSGLENARNNNKRLESQLLAIRHGIEDYCSDITRKKILKLVGWQFSEEEARRIDSLPSDKELVGPLLNQDEPKHQQL